MSLPLTGEDWAAEMMSAINRITAIRTALEDTVVNLLV